ncbi:MAG TPA: hypothetical protein PKD78_11660, partial [Saprospiraceae bacterium]|nr:hypothetical protein [Saprospiraceae bacterium]
MRFATPLLLLLCLVLTAPASAQVDISTGWRFRLGDDPEWAKPEFVDTIWSEPILGIHWEQQGFADYNGHAWYRVHFFLPRSLRDNSKLKDGVRITLGTIDDCDISYLNGQPIGQTGSMPYEQDYASAWQQARRYVLPADHPALKWDAENVLALRVYDGDGPGGIYGPGPRNITMTDLMEFVRLDANSEPFVFSGKDSLSKVVYLENSFTRPVSGDYEMRLSAPPTPAKRIELKGEKASVQDLKPSPDRVIWEKKTPLTLKPGERLALPCSLLRSSEGAVLRVVFTEKSTGKALSAQVEAPYILTPAASPKPRITNAQVYGARPGTPFRYTITASGERPMMFEAS